DLQLASGPEMDQLMGSNPYRGAEIGLYRRTEGTPSAQEFVAVWMQVHYRDHIGAAAKADQLRHRRYTQRRQARLPVTVYASTACG
ncbi:MAG TPA: hypothetical protein VGO93_07420, partial [Candidatus Xenobia bacterium]